MYAIAIINYKTTAAITISLGAGIDPAFDLQRGTEVLLSSKLSILNVNVALVLTLRVILGSAAVPLSGNVSLKAGDQINLRYNADGLTVSLGVGGLEEQVSWSVKKVAN